MSLLLCLVLVSICLFTSRNLHSIKKGFSSLLDDSRNGRLFFSFFFFFFSEKRKLEIRAYALYRDRGTNPKAGALDDVLTEYISEDKLPAKKIFKHAHIAALIIDNLIKKNTGVPMRHRGDNEDSFINNSLFFKSWFFTNGQVNNFLNRLLFSINLNLLYSF